MICTSSAGVVRPSRNRSTRSGGLPSRSRVNSSGPRDVPGVEGPQQDRVHPPVPGRVRGRWHRSGAGEQGGGDGGGLALHRGEGVAGRRPRGATGRAQPDDAAAEPARRHGVGHRNGTVLDVLDLVRPRCADGPPPAGQVGGQLRVVPLVREPLARERRVLDQPGAGVVRENVPEGHTRREVRDGEVHEHRRRGIERVRAEADGPASEVLQQRGRRRAPRPGWAGVQHPAGQHRAVVGP